MSSSEELILNQDASLVEVVDRVIHKGVALEGDVMLSVADVDLIYLGLKLVLCSADRVGDTPFTASKAHTQAEQMRAGRSSHPRRQPLAAVHRTVPELSEAQTADTADMGRVVGAQPGGDHSLLPPLKAGNQQEAASGLAQLVLTLVELLRQLMERQAVRRMENGTITDEEVERVGETFMQISQRMEELKQIFNLEDADLNLDLGPLGNLLD